MTAAVGILLILITVPARAVQATVGSGKAVADAQAQANTTRVASDLPNASLASSNAASIEDALRAAESEARVWHYGWTIFFGVGLVTRVSLALALENDRIRTTQWVGAVPVASGLLFQALQPPPALGLDEDLRTATTPEARLALLRVYAEAEQDRRGWLQHVLGVAVNIGAATYLLLANDDLLAAALQVGIGTAVSEVRIWTSPTAATEALEQLNAQQLSLYYPDDDHSASLHRSNARQPAPLASQAFVAAVGLGSVWLQYRF